MRNLERNLDLATSNLKEAKYRVTERRADVLEAQLGKLCLMLELRDAQLRSLRGGACGGAKSTGCSGGAGGSGLIILSVWYRTYTLDPYML